MARQVFSEPGSMKYGFRFLGEPSFWESLQMADVELLKPTPMIASDVFVMPEGLRPQIKELIEHLQKSGTGIAKLKKIAEIGKKTVSSIEFFGAVKLSVPPGTWDKISAFMEMKEREAATQLANVKPVETGKVETGSSSQEDGTDILTKEEDKEVENPTKNFNVTEAVIAINSNKFSKDELEAIVVLEERKTITQAAAKRLESLNS